MHASGADHELHGQLNSMPLEEPTETEKAENRVFATGVLDALKAAQANLMTLSVEMGKWIQTSLLAINGAAAIATFPVQIPVAFKLGACAAFIAGILLALGGGYLQIRMLGRMAESLGGVMGYWIEVQADGWRLPDLEANHDLKGVEKKAMLIPQIIGWGSVGAFVIGCVVTGAGALQPT